MSRKIFGWAAVAVLVTTGTVAGTSQAAAEQTGVQARYGGETISLGWDWRDAEVCAEFAVGDVRCYRTAADYAAATGDLGTTAATDCPSGWVCLWADINHENRRLQWSAGGTKKLADWGFRDAASSAAVRRVQNGVTLVNYRTALPDQTAFLRAGGIYSDFRSFGWNDKTDEIRM